MHVYYESQWLKPELSLETVLSLYTNRIGTEKCFIIFIFFPQLCTHLWGFMMNVINFIMTQYNRGEPLNCYWAVSRWQDNLMPFRHLNYAVPPPEKIGSNPAIPLSESAETVKKINRKWVVQNTNHVSPLILRIKVQTKSRPE